MYFIEQEFLDRQDGSVEKVLAEQIRYLDLIPRSNGGMRKLTPKGCPLTSVCMLWHGYADSHIQVSHAYTLTHKNKQIDLPRAPCMPVTASGGG